MMKPSILKVYVLYPKGGIQSYYPNKDELLKNIQNNIDYWSREVEYATNKISGDRAKKYVEEYKQALETALLLE